MMTNAVLLPALMLVAFSQSYVFNFIREGMSWSGAQTYCRQRHTDLATISDRMDLDELMRSVDQGYRGNVWIGLYRSGASAPWIWSDHSKSTFMPWGPEERKHTITRLTVQSSGDVNDPSVKAALLLKIEQRLQEMGLTRDVKLSWRIQSDGNVFQKHRK